MLPAAVLSHQVTESLNHGSIRRMSLLYAVSLGVPASCTARITCATPATRGVTIARAELAPSIVTRGGGCGGPSTGADGMFPAPGSLTAAGTRVRIATGCPGIPIPASG